MQPKRFPFGSWVSMGKDEWDIDLGERVHEWSDIGFTLAFSAQVTDEPATHASARRLLDLCADADIQVILTDTRATSCSGDWGEPSRVIPLPEGYRENAAAAIEEFADHPAVWGLYITDEPLHGNFPAVAEACRIVRELTDKVEPYVNYLPNHLLAEDGTHREIQRQVGFEDFAAYLDYVVEKSEATMLCYDDYSSMSPEWGGPTNWYQGLSLYQGAAIRHDIPFWPIVLTVGHWMYRAPSPLEMGWQFYNALAYGAQGIIYFWYRGGGLGTYGAPVDELGNRGPLFHQLQRQHHQFMTDWSWRYRDCKPVSTWHWPQAPVGVERFDGTGVVASIEENPGDVRRETPPAQVVAGELRDSQGRPHVLVANGSWEKHASLGIRVQGTAVHRIAAGQESPMRSSRTPDGGTSIQEHIMPGQGLFFRVEQ